ncbi:MAG: hypothetical protein KDD11_04210 [Acidobacteria bacterium]|nr:hypothetical protein [Acidobacteriota bacterium]
MITKLRSSLLLTALLLVSTTGCLSLDLLLKVAPDGTGRLFTEVRIQKAYLQMAEGLLGDDTSGQPGAGGMFSDDNLERMAARLGEGVQLVSSKVVEDDTSRGVRAEFSVPDVTKLSLGELPVSPTRGKTQFTLEPAKDGRSSVFSLTFPPVEGKQGQPLMSGADVAQMKDLLQGLKIDFAIEVPGKIIETNSPFVQGNRVTVASLDLDQLLASPKAVETLTSTPAASVAEVGRLLNDFPGVSFHPEDTLTIEFRAPAAKQAAEAPAAKGGSDR